MAPALQARDTALRQVEARLRAAAAPPPDAARLRVALAQELHDDSTRPEWVPFEAPVMPGALLDGLVHLVASPNGVPPFRAPGVLWGRVGWAAA